MERILVTGGAGFIGSHTVDVLLAQDKEVVVLDNLSSGKLENLQLNHPNLEFIEGDILEFPLLSDLVADCDAVLHLAAITSVPFSIENPIYTFQVNVLGFLHVVEAIAKTKRFIRLVYASSAAVYGNTTPPCHDDEPLTNQPLSPYALQKIENENFAQLYRHMYGLSILGLRYFNAYGERQDPASPYSGVISRFLSDYRDQKTLTVFGDGEQTRDFIFVKDIANANVLALMSQVDGVLNIASGKGETLLELIHCLEKMGGQKAEIQFKPARPGDILHSYASVNAAKKELGFVTKTDLMSGLKTMRG